jgi:hypothetical protein
MNGWKSALNVGTTQTYALFCTNLTFNLVDFLINGSLYEKYRPELIVTYKTHLEHFSTLDNLMTCEVNRMSWFESDA